MSRNRLPLAMFQVFLLTFCTVSTDTCAQTDYFGSAVYGNTLVASSLYNTPLTANVLYDNRIIFPRSGNIVSVKKYFVGLNGGYGSGTGGSVKYELRPDDGTANHLPTATVLGQTVPLSGGPSRTANQMPTVKFTSPIAVSANVWYHLIAYNTDNNPNTNYLSLDDLWDGNQPSKVRNPIIPDLQLAVLYNDGAGWTTLGGFTAVVDFAYTDNSHFGVGYMEVSSTAAGSGTGHLVSGQNQVREVFTVSGADKAVTSLSAAVVRISGTSPITATLVSPTGSISATNNTVLKGASTYEPDNQYFGAFNLATILHAGVTYSLEFSAPSDTVYSIHGVRDGAAAGYGWNSQTVFSDGWAQYNTGSGWSNWDTWGTPDKSQDLSFYFPTQPAECAANGLQQAGNRINPF